MNAIMFSEAPTVAPFTGAWIEISTTTTTAIDSTVAPFTGVWIEIRPGRQSGQGNVSLPSRWRGLKFGRLHPGSRGSGVAPFTGAWIEIAKAGGSGLQHSVAPFVGAWIRNATTYGFLPAVCTPVPVEAWIGKPIM